MKPIAVLGIISICDFPFLLLVETAEQISDFDSSIIYKVRDINFLHLHNEAHSKESYEVSSFIQGLRNLLSLGFYFSFNYNLTHTRQRQSKLAKSGSIIEKAEEKYFWNHSLYNEFRENKIDEIFYTIVICGYVGYFSENISDKNEENNNDSGK